MSMQAPIADRRPGSPRPARPPRHREIGPSRRAEPPRVAAYARVSTAAQADDGVSLAAQAERLAMYCVARGWSLQVIYFDAGASGKDLDRPGLQAAIAAAEEGAADVLLATKIDRLTRRVPDLYALIERCDAAGVKLAAVSDNLDTSSASGQMLVSILGVVAEWERGIIAERTAAALAHKRTQGEHVGAVPFGFRIGADGRLEEHPDELRTIALMKRWRRRGASYQQLADRLNADGVRARRGRWSKSSVHALVNDHLRSRKARYLGASNGTGVR